MDCGHGCGGEFVIETCGETHGSEHAQFVFRETALRIADGADESGFQVFASTDEIQNFVGGGVEHHAIDGEVAALHVLARVFGEANLVGMAAVGVADVGAKGGDFDCGAPALGLTGECARCSIGLGHQHYSELFAYG